MYSKILDFIDESKVRFNEPMKNNNESRRTSGCYGTSKALEDLKYHEVAENEIKWYVIGNGSNLLVEMKV